MNTIGCIIMKVVYNILTTVSNKYYITRLYDMS